MEVKDFLPKYPDIEKSSYDVLDPYGINFYEAIYRKKEFYENRLQRAEEFPKEKGVLTKHQKTFSRYMSSHTPYDKVLVVHAMGTGKTCSAIGAIELIRSENSTIDGAIILAKGKTVLRNFTDELVFKCTGGKYVPENYKNLTENEQVRRINKKIRSFYSFNTFGVFAKKLKNKSDGDITEEYSNKIIVIDEVHNLRIQDKEDSIEIYPQYFRFLHLLKNCKVILMSGTPMKDTPDEIASVMNLILPVKDVLPTGDDFIEEFLEKKDGAYIVRENKVDELKRKFKGRISFLREMQSTVKRDYLGEKNVGGLKHFVVDVDTMSSFQSKVYVEAFETKKPDKSELAHPTKKKGGPYLDARYAALFVFPDKSYGPDGFKKYIVSSEKGKRIGGGKGPKTYRLSDDFSKMLKGSTDEETLKNIRKYSSKYASVIKEILETDGNCFVYSSLVLGSGAILFSLLLGLFGFKRANGRESTKERRYGILTGKTASDAELRKIKDRFNRPDNINGDYIKVIIGSKSVSEAFSFNNVLFEAILTPHWNYSETAQALARGIRLGSHNDLLKAGIDPVVRIMQAVSFPKNRDIKSVDLIMYKLSEDKDIVIRMIMRILMESAFDCALNYFRNHISGFDYQRECDYVKCDYKCEGIKPSLLQRELKNLDMSTYQLYYANESGPPIRHKIEMLLKENSKMDNNAILSNLKGQFGDWEISNALKSLEDVKGDVDYNYYKTTQNLSSVKIIMDEIEILFKENFKLTLDFFKNFFKNSTLFEILTALRTLINDNVSIYNRYGFVSYLREENDSFFLVNDLTVANNSLSGFYTEHPIILDKKDFTEVVKDIYSNSLPELIRNICDCETADRYNKLIKTVPIEIQQIFLEGSIVAEDSKLKELTLDYFKGYIKTIDDTVISTLNKDNFRCKKIDADYSGWRDCEQGYENKIVEFERKRKKKAKKKNPYKIVGKYNPENGAFCIVDYTLEKESTDTRVSRPGKRCKDGWKLPELINMIVNRLKIDPPETYLPVIDRSSLLTKLNKSIEEPKSKIASIITKKELKNLSDEDMRRLAYWGLTSTKGGNSSIQTICTAMRAWLEEKGLVEIDTLCGVQGKTKKIDAKGKKGGKEKKFTVQTIDPKKDTEKFRSTFGDVAKMTEECFGEKKYVPEIGEDIWVFVYIRNLVSYLVLDKNNVIKRMCVSKKYRRQNIPVESTSAAVESIMRRTGLNNVNLIVENRAKDYKKLISMYTSFGFSITKDDGKNTVMVFKGGKGKGK